MISLQQKIAIDIVWRVVFKKFTVSMLLLKAFGTEDLDFYLRPHEWCEDVLRSVLD